MFNLFAPLDARVTAPRALPEPPVGTVVGAITLYLTTDAPLVVPADRIGALAVHRLVSSAERWGVSHAGTGG